MQGFSKSTSMRNVTDKDLDVMAGETSTVPVVGAFYLCGLALCDFTQGSPSGYLFEYTHNMYSSPIFIGPDPDEAVNSNDEGDSRDALGNQWVHSLRQLKLRGKAKAKKANAKPKPKAGVLIIMDS